MKLLVVEDQPRMARLLLRGLEEEGYSVELARDGPEAIWAATEAEFDAIVLDVMLPGCDGFEVCRRLRQTGRWAPVLMLTARDAVPDRIAGLDSGADDYLVTTTAGTHRPWSGTRPATAMTAGPRAPAMRHTVSPTLTAGR